MLTIVADGKVYEWGKDGTEFPQRKYTSNIQVGKITRVFLANRAYVLTSTF